MIAQWPASARFALTVAVIAAAAATALFAQTGTLAGRQTLVDVSLAAQLVSFNGGQVSVLRGSTPWALNVGDYVQPGQVIVTGLDGDALFKVVDGSTFEVFPKSKVTFRANRGNWEDLLELVLGKIRVHIEHPGGVPNNNKVRTPTAVISVRGTIFDVQYDPDAENTLVYDEEGAVEVARALRLNDTKILNPGEHVLVYKNDPLARAIIDKEDLLKRIFHSVMDAATQAAINNRSGAAGTPSTTPGNTTAGDHNGTTPPPPPH